MPREFKYKYKTKSMREADSRRVAMVRVRRLVVVLCIATIFLSVATYYFYVKDLENTNTIKNLQQQILITIETIQNNTRTIDTLNADIRAKKIVITELSNKLGFVQSEVQALTPIIKTYYATAVSGGEGVVIPVEVKLTKGSGLISVDIKNVELQSDVQDSVRIAVAVAQEYAGVDFSKKDVTVSFINERSELVVMDGPSAGAVITTTIIAAAENKTINTKILATGTIMQGGSIGEVGGVTEKAMAAKDFGAKIFLVPVGEKTPVAGIEVAEVKSIQEVVNLVLS